MYGKIRFVFFKLEFGMKLLEWLFNILINSLNKHPGCRLHSYLNKYLASLSTNTAVRTPRLFDVMNISPIRDF